jgi:photosystem II stability/assembly factor-like uncharacterized protein
MKQFLINRVILTITGILASVITFPQSWTMQNVGFQLNGSDPFKVSIVNANVAWTIGDYHLGAMPDQEFSKTVDGGSHWTAGTITSSASHSNVSVSAINESIAYVAQTDKFNGNGYIYKTTDGGASWSPRGVGQIFIHPGVSFCVAVYFWNEAEGITFGDQYNGRFEIFTTSDGGMNWSPVPTANIPPAQTNEIIYPKSYQVIDSTIWITTSMSRIFKSTDRGVHWNVYSMGIPDPAMVTIQSDKLTGLAITTSMNTYKTMDGGITWTPLPSSGPRYFFVQSIPGTNYYVSSESVLNNSIGSSYSMDGGSTWTAIDTAGRGTTNGYFWLTFYDINTGYASGFTQNSTTDGIYKWDPGILGIKEPEAHNNLTVYPNPFVDKISVDGIIPGTQLQLYYLSGSLVLDERVNGNKVEIDMSGFPTGLYFLRSGAGSAKVVKL